MGTTLVKLDNRKNSYDAPRSSVQYACQDAGASTARRAKRLGAHCAGQLVKEVTMTLYLYRLFPPRPRTFAADMTPAEMKVMQEHANYWQQHVASGKVLVVGPVADPEGTFGMAVIGAEEGEDVEPFCKDDPAIKSGLGFSYKLNVMPKHIVSPKIQL